MNILFDYSKHSVQEYNDLLNRLYLGEEVDISFKLPVLEIETNPPRSTRISFPDGIWIDVDGRGWDAHKFNQPGENHSSSRTYYVIGKRDSSETLNIGNSYYSTDKNGIIDHKRIFVKNTNAHWYNNSKLVLTSNGTYSFNVEYFKKYKEYQLHTDTGLSYFEKVSYTNGTLSTSIRVQDKNKNKYSISISRNSKTKGIEFILSKDFKKGTVHSFHCKDASIDTIYNKYTMLEFDLTASAEEYEILSSVRELLKTHIKELYTKLKKDNKNATVVWNILKKLEEFEDDEYQIQRRKA